MNKMKIMNDINAAMAAEGTKGLGAEPAIRLAVDPKRGNVERLGAQIYMHSRMTENQYNAGYCAKLTLDTYEARVENISVKCRKVGGSWNFKLFTEHFPWKEKTISNIQLKEELVAEVGYYLNSIILEEKKTSTGVLYPVFPQKEKRQRDPKWYLKDEEVSTPKKELPAMGIVDFYEDPAKLRLGYVTLNTPAVSVKRIAIFGDPETEGLSSEAPKQKLVGTYEGKSDKFYKTIKGERWVYEALIYRRGERNILRYLDSLIVGR